MGEVIYPLDEGQTSETSKKTTKDKVEDILERKEQARNSDKYLIWYYWKYEEEIESLDNFGEFKEGTSSRSIVRARAEIQNDEGKYLPTDPEVISKRRIKENRIREYYSEKKTREILGE
jgi:hypothetical protein